MTLDPHYDGGRSRAMFEYYQGYYDGSEAKRTDWRYEENVHPYKTGWNCGYENSGMHYLEVMAALKNKRTEAFKDLK